MRYKKVVSIFKRPLLFIGIIIAIAACSTGCFNKKIKLDYIQVPDGITIKGYENSEQINKLDTQLKELKNKQASREDQQKVLDRIEALAKECVIEVEDKDFINNVIAQIQNLQGTAEGAVAALPKGKVLFEMQFSIEFLY